MSRNYPDHNARDLDISPHVCVVNGGTRCDICFGPVPDAPRSETARDLDYAAAEARLVERGYELAASPPPGAGVTATVTPLDGQIPADQAAPASEKRDRLIATTSEERKNFPMAEGLMDYFPDALAAVARHSYESNQKHNPGEPMHWARGKSMDHADCIMRHLQRRGKFDGAARESTALAWRALALLQEELEAAYGLDLPRAARLPSR